MRPRTLDIDLDTVDADGLADNNDSSGASLTLDGALTSGGTYTSVDGLAHRLSITDTATQDQSDSTFTVTGTDADGRAQTEAITGPGSGLTVTSTKYFKTVTSVAISGGDASDTVDMGTVDEAATQTIILDHYQSVAPTLQGEVTGTIDFDIQVTVKNPFSGITDQESLAFVNDDGLGTLNDDFLDSLSRPGLRAMRFVVNSYSTGAEVQLHITQPRSV